MLVSPTKGPTFKMPVFKQPTLASACFLMEFARPVKDMRFQQKLAETAFSSFINVQSQQSNFPDNMDPGLPRIMFSSEKKSILLSQTGCQLNFNFSQNTDPLEKQMLVLEKNAKEFYLLALNKFAVAEYRLTAVILDLQFPSDSKNEDLQKFLFDRFIKTPSKYPVASVQTLLGFRVNDYFVNFSAQAYETRSAEIVHQAGANVKNTEYIRLDEMEVVDTGVSFRIDVNTRPVANAKNFKQPVDASGIFLQLNEFLANSFYALSGLKLYE